MSEKEKSVKIQSDMEIMKAEVESPLENDVEQEFPIEDDMEHHSPLENTSINESEIVAPCFCCKMDYTACYKFINVLDIVLLSLSIIGGLTVMYTKSKYSKSLPFDLAWLIVAIICLIKFNKNGDYGTGLHLCYAITRIVYSIILLISFVIFVIVIIFSPTYFNIEIFGSIIVFLVLASLIVGTITAFSCYWSMLFHHVIEAKRAKNEKTKVEVLSDEALTDEEMDIRASGGI